MPDDAEIPPGGVGKAGMRTDQMVQTLTKLAPDEQARMLDVLTALVPPPPGSKANVRIWYIIVFALSFALVGGMVMLFVLIMASKPTEVIVPLVTAGLGAIVGLLAPSPMKGRSPA
jgi:hypothetical protein